MKWRVIEIERKEGSFNASLDVLLMESIRKFNSSPAIVFTEWMPTVSIGNSESFERDVDKEACKFHNVEVIRRKSGGQSVYLNENYIVFSIIGRKELFDKDLSIMRKSLCGVVIKTLNQMNIPAEFYPPDNIVINNRNHLKTLGNSGQIISSKVINIHGSIRYKLSELDTLIDVLKINGRKINHYGKDIRNILTDTYTYNNKISKRELKNQFLKNFSEDYGIELYFDSLRKEEELMIEPIKKEIRMVKDKEWYSSKGICYLFLNGRNLLSGSEGSLPFNKPSSVEDSIMFSGGEYGKIKSC